MRDVDNNFVGDFLIQIVYFSSAEYASLSRLLYPVTLIPCLFLLLALKWHNHFFTWIGGYAYSIYLFMVSEPPEGELC